MEPLTIILISFFCLFPILHHINSTKHFTKFDAQSLMPGCPHDVNHLTISSTSQAKKLLDKRGLAIVQKGMWRPSTSTRHGQNPDEG